MQLAGEQRDVPEIDHAAGCFGSCESFGRSGLLGFSGSAAGDDRYRDEIERWRQKRLADLKAEDGWLSVSGLFWLKPGETKIGSDPSNDVLLPARLPGSVGSLKLADGKASFRPATGFRSPATASRSREASSSRTRTDTRISWRWAT